MSVEPAQIANLTLETRIDAPANVVWETLTDRIGEWWPAEFYAGGEPGNRDFHLEARPGGMMYESWGDGGGLLWGTVVTVNPSSTLQMLGNVFPDWGGPTQFYATWELKEEGGVTTLRFSESGVGQVSDASTAEKDKGWTFLWATLKAHVEGTDKPAWE